MAYSNGGIVLSSTDHSDRLQQVSGVHHETQGLGRGVGEELAVPVLAQIIDGLERHFLEVIVHGLAGSTALTIVGFGHAVGVVLSVIGAAPEAPAGHAPVSIVHVR